MVVHKGCDAKLARSVKQSKSMECHRNLVGTSLPRMCVANDEAPTRNMPFPLERIAEYYEKMKKRSRR